MILGPLNKCVCDICSKVVSCDDLEYIHIDFFGTPRWCIDYSCCKSHNQKERTLFEDIEYAKFRSSQVQIPLADIIKNI